METSLTAKNNYNGTAENNSSDDQENSTSNRSKYFALPVRRLRRSDVPQLETLLGPLHRLARDGKAEDLAVILGLNQRSVDERDDAKQTALHYAAGRPSNVKCVTLLLAHGANPNARDFWGGTPLHNAVRIRDVPCIKTLLTSKSIHPSPVDLRRWSPLHMAVVFRRLDIVRLLVERGANQSIMNEAGSTPMMIAKAANFHEIINYLIEASVDKQVVK